MCLDGGACALACQSSSDCSLDVCLCMRAHTKLALSALCLHVGVSVPVCHARRCCRCRQFSPNGAHEWARGDTQPGSCRRGRCTERQRGRAAAVEDSPRSHPACAGCHTAGVAGELWVVGACAACGWLAARLMLCFLQLHVMCLKDKHTLRHMCIYTHSC